MVANTHDPHYSALRRGCTADHAREVQQHADHTIDVSLFKVVGQLQKMRSEHDKPLWIVFMSLLAYLRGLTRKMHDCYSVTHDLLSINTTNALVAKTCEQPLVAPHTCSERITWCVHDNCDSDYWDRKTLTQLEERGRTPG